MLSESLNMKNLYIGTLRINYGQYYINPIDGEWDCDIEKAFEGQVNGMCGASNADSILLLTGIEVGTISIEFNLHDSLPKLDDTYEDVVEVSFTRGERPICLSDWDNVGVNRLDIPSGSYRLRYSADGLDNDYKDSIENEKFWKSPVPGQRHLIEIWRSAMEPDSIRRQNSKTAEHLHAAWGTK